MCPVCGVSLPEGASVCSACGHRLSDAAPESSRRVVYAGFWLRLLAYALDTIVVSLVTTPTISAVLRNFGLGDLTPAQFFDSAFMQQHAGPIFLANVITLIEMGLYSSLLESSPWQATLGKRVVGLRVTDLNGQRLSFGRATTRYFAKMLSALSLMIGYVMAGFTEKKQALHDLLVGTLVTRRT